MANTLNTLLNKRREVLIAKLMAKEPELTSELVQLFDAQLTAEKPVNRPVREGEWSGYKWAIDAITEYLVQRKEWTNRFAIMDDLVAGGYGAGEEKPRWNVDSAIRYYTKRGKHPRLARHGDLIGLIGWEAPKE
jgi:hypothetical protein